jgi:hypothetical protein
MPGASGGVERHNSVCPGPYRRLQCFGEWAKIGMKFALAAQQTAMVKNKLTVPKA